MATAELAQRITDAISQLEREGQPIIANKVHEMTGGNRSEVLAVVRAHLACGTGRGPTAAGIGTDPVPSDAGTAPDAAEPPDDPPAPEAITPDWAPVEAALAALRQAEARHQEAVQALATLNETIDQQVLADYAGRLRRELGLALPPKGGMFVHGLAGDRFEEVRRRLASADHAVTTALEASARCRQAVHEARQAAIGAARRQWLRRRFPDLDAALTHAEERLELAPDSARLQQALQAAWKDLLAHQQEAPTWATEGPRADSPRTVAGLGEALSGAQRHSKF